MTRAGRSLFGLALWVGACVATWVASAAPVRAQGGTLEYLSRYLVAPDDLALMERDALLGFNRHFGQEARRLLDEGSPDAFEIAVALVAIGASGLEEEMGRLQTAATEGDGLLRQAGIIALGEIGTRGGKLLLSMVDDERDTELVRLCLLRSGHELGRRVLLDRFRQNGADEGIMQLLDFVDRPGSFETVPGAARLVFELRFNAARDYGLVDGQRWGVHLMTALAEDDAFLDQVVFLAAADTYEPAVPDFVLERLMTQGGVAPLVAALRCMRPELMQLVANELYAPTALVEWRAVMREFDHSEPTIADEPLLRLALAVPAIELEAHTHLARLGDTESAEFLRDQLADASAAVRAQAAAGLGGSRSKEWIVELERMKDDPDALVRMSALVGRVRLGSGFAMARAREVANNPEHVDYTTLAVALAFKGEDPVVRQLLAGMRDRALGETRMVIDTALRRAGDRLVGRKLVEVLSVPSGLDDRAWIVTTLAQYADRQDVPFLESVFPSEHFPGINTDVAVALARLGSREGSALLREALWRGPFDRSQLAAAALVDEGGVKLLATELESAPLGTSSEAMRRVGFAIGLYGGMDELDRLRLRRGPGDPALLGAYLGTLMGRTF